MGKSKPESHKPVDRMKNARGNIRPKHGNSTMRTVKRFKRSGLVLRILTDGDSYSVIADLNHSQYRATCLNKSQAKSLYGDLVKKIKKMDKVGFLGNVDKYLKGILVD